MSDFFVYCFPVCGGSFPSLMALLQKVCDARIHKTGKRGKKSYSPDLCLGSSGGNLVSYIGLASNWDSELIEKISFNLSSTMFVRRWINNHLLIFPEIFFALNNRSMFNEGTGGLEFFQQILTEDSILSTEIWTGTYDSECKKSQFFCNKSKGDSYINFISFNEDQSLYLSKKLIFCDGDIRTIYNVTLASASIPLLVPPKKIFGSDYGDGGVMYASPLTVFGKEIARIVSGIEKHYNNGTHDIPNTDENEQIILSVDNNVKKNLRLFYFMRTRDFTPTEKSGLLDNLLKSILDSSALKDRNKAIELLETLSPEGISTETYLEIKNDELSDILEEYSQYNHYVICLFPHLTPTISITDFTGENVVNIMEHVRENFGCQIWHSNNKIKNGP